MTRKLASIRRIDDVRPIEGADAIECAILGGWQVVVKKGEYAPGDVAVYLEVDSWVPTTVAPFLTREGKEPGEFNGVKGERLRTIKLRGQISQGLLLPLSVLPSNWFSHAFTHGIDSIIGEDVTSYLGVQKWEQALPTELAGQVNGVFVSFVPKTDEERCLSGETLVDTPNGQKRIDTLKQGDSVLTYNHASGKVEPKMVTGVMVQPQMSSGWFKIKTASGKEIVATGNHLIWVEGLNCYRRVDELCVGDTLRSF